MEEIIVKNENKPQEGDFNPQNNNASSYLKVNLEYIQAHDKKFINKYNEQMKQLQLIEDKLTLKEQDILDNVLYELITLYTETIINLPFIEIRLTNGGGK